MTPGGRSPALLLLVAVLAAACTGSGAIAAVRTPVPLPPIPTPTADRGRQNSSGRIYQPYFALTNTVQSLALEIVVSQPKEFVFYINPADIPPPSPPEP